MKKDLQFISIRFIYIRRLSGDVLNEQFQFYWRFLGLRHMLVKCVLFCAQTGKPRKEIP